MSITINIIYHGKDGSARAFVQEMTQRGIVEQIRAEKGNESYAYFQPLDDPESILLIDRWSDQAALDLHHESPMMGQIALLREKYDLHMEVSRFIDLDDAADERFIRR